ncbi:ATP-binding protein [Alteromonadaceae bacterium BrNp21-10]|nr:ATP-binding protein [Alteromonadaceae bacterium BrNp21-10]
MKKKRLLDNSLPTWLLIAAIVMTIIGGNSYLAIETIEDLSKTQQQLFNTSEAAIALNNLHISLLSAETGQRGYLLTQKEEYLTPYKRALRTVSDQIEIVSSLKFQHHNQLQTVEQLLDLSQKKLDELEMTIALAMGERENIAIKQVMTGRGRNIYRDIHSIINELKAAEITYRNKQYDKLLTIQKEAKVTFLISGITSALLLIGMLALARVNLHNEDRLRKSLEAQNEKLTEQVEIRTQELTMYSEELSRSNRELENFAFVASHDLQEPLRKIRAFGDRLMSSYGNTIDRKGLDYISRMKAAAERMSNLINDLLEFSRITTRGKEFIEVDLNNIMNEILGDLEIAIEESNAQITTDTLPIIQSDAGQIYQLFLNLISNAIKFRKANTPPKINIKYQHDSTSEPLIDTHMKWHVFQITDNGIGFEAEFADKIFVPFQRLHGRNEYKGTGIGLAICQRIVERHGGVIHAESKVGEGTTFIIRIPVEATPFHNHGK